MPSGADRARPRLTVELLAVVLLVSAVGTSAWGASSAIPAPLSESSETTTEVEAQLRPGQDSWTKDGRGCTLSFVLEDGIGKLYFLTSGHCVSEGDVLYRTSSLKDRFGTVVAENDGVGWDWALIAVDAAEHEFVSPSVTHWSGPTGVVVGSEEDYAGDKICYYGQGPPEDASELNPRCGTLEGFSSASHRTPHSFYFRGFGIGGDSGAPVIHYETGLAVGTISAGLAWYQTGPTLCTQLQDIRDGGYETRLKTAPYDPPPPMPTVPVDAPEVMTEPISACPR